LPAYERIDAIDALGLYSIARRLRRKKYETRLVLRHSHLCIEDLAFNSILIRANALLVQIAQEIKTDIPGWLYERMKKSPHALELLWSEVDEQYLSRNFDTFELINQPSIMAFLPLYAGTISKKRAAHLVEKLKSHGWNTKFPVPSVPITSKFFQPKRYWQGPTWINTNWLIADGLTRYGYLEEAEAIKQSSLDLVEEHGAFEYFSPLDGTPAGAHPFSWTAALTIDLLKNDNFQSPILK
jgi:neutral trehalase